MLKLNLNSQSLGKLLPTLKNISKKASNIEDALPKVSQIVRENLATNLSTMPLKGGISKGNRKEVLSSGLLNTGIRSKKVKLSDNTNQKVMQALTVESNSAFIKEATKDKMKFGVNLPEAEYIQKKSNLFTWNPILLDKVTKYLSNYVVEKKPNG